MIHLRHVDKRYGAAWALRDVSLEVPAGAIYGLIGPNGAGKTTVLRLLGRLAKPTAGEILFSGDGRAGPTRPACVGYLPQRVAFNGLATPREVLRLFGRLRHMPASRAEEGLDAAGLREAADDEIRTLSGGMRQRLGLAVACLGDPDVLLLDEPDAGLDPRAAIDLRQRVRRLVAEGRTIVISSHSLPELETVADRLAILVSGRVVLEGPVAALRAMAARGSLEDLFMEATA